MIINPITWSLIFLNVCFIELPERMRFSNTKYLMLHINCPNWYKTTTTNNDIYDTL